MGPCACVCVCVYVFLCKILRHFELFGFLNQGIEGPSIKLPKSFCNHSQNAKNSLIGIFTRNNCKLKVLTKKPDVGFLADVSTFRLFSPKMAVLLKNESKIRMKNHPMSIGPLISKLMNWEIHI